MSRASELKFLLRVVVSVGLIGYLFSLLDWALLSTLRWDILGHFGFCVLILSVLLFPMSWRWKLMIDPECNARVSPWLLYRYYLIGIFFSIFLPGAIGGDVVRVTYASRRFELGWRRSTAIVFSERLFGLSALGCLFAAGFLLGSRLFQALQLEWYHGLLAGGGAVAVFVIARELAARRIRVSYRRALLLLALSGLGQAADILNAGVIAAYFAQAIELRDLMVIMPVVYVSTILPISLGGLGVREGVMVGLLSFLGVEASIALVIALAVYLAKVVVGLAGGFLYSRGDRISIAELRKDEGSDK